MGEYIDKSALVAEIKKHRAIWDGMDGDYCKGQRLAYSDVISILNTLEVKEVDLEEEIKRFTTSKELYEADSVIKAVAEHFYELGLKAQTDAFNDKACRAIEKLLSGYIIRNFNFGDSYNIDRLIEDFKNYMKEE